MNRMLIVGFAKSVALLQPRQTFNIRDQFRERKRRRDFLAVH
jgi:hypothetical protein